MVGPAQIGQRHHASARHVEHGEFGRAALLRRLSARFSIRRRSDHPWATTRGVKAMPRRPGDHRGPAREPGNHRRPQRRARPGRCRRSRLRLASTWPTDAIAGHPQAAASAWTRRREPPRRRGPGARRHRVTTPGRRRLVQTIRPAWGEAPGALRRARRPRAWAPGRSRPTQRPGWSRATTRWPTRHQGTTRRDGRPSR